MRKPRTITNQAVNSVKELLPKCNSLRIVARKAGVSYYTVVQIKNGRYDQEGPLVAKIETAFFNERQRENWLI